MTNKICEVCSSKGMVNILDLGMHPMCDDLIRVGSKKRNRNYKINILFCKKCNTAHQKFQINKKILFPNQYHYRARFTKDVVNGLQSIFEISKDLLINYENKKILDIGCNDGTLLDFFKKERSITIGVEPTSASIDAKKKGHVVYSDYFDEKVVSKILKKFKSIDLIVFTNVFAHIENLNLLIENLKKIISKNTIIIIENHYMKSVLDKYQFDTFYHEHPRTYSATSFKYIAERLDTKFLNISFPKRYGGNIRLIMKKKKNNESSNFNKKILIKERKLYKTFKSLQKKIEIWKFKKTNLITKLVKKYGPLPSKAFPGRSAILIKLLNLDQDRISAVFEKSGSMKIGCYVPGTRIPILDDSKIDLKKKNLKVIINFAWHIENEIKTYLRKKGYKGRIIDILSKNDFK